MNANTPARKASVALTEKPSPYGSLRVQAIADRITGFDRSDEEEPDGLVSEPRKALPGHMNPDRGEE